jgi:hypothetical protein
VREILDMPGEKVKGLLQDLNLFNDELKAISKQIDVADEQLIQAY